MSESPITAKQLRAMLRAEEYDKAMPILEALLRKNPNDAPVLWHFSSCLMAFGRDEEALAAVKRVLEINPNYAPAWLRHAELSSILHDDEYPDYVHDLRKAVEADPNNVEALRTLAISVHDVENPSEAHQLLAKAISLEPNNTLNYWHRSLWHVGESLQLAAGETGLKQFNGTAMSPAKLEKALADINACIRLEPSNMQHLTMRANILHQLHRYDEAIADCDSLIATAPVGSPQEQAYRQLRKRSENNGAGERDMMADAMSNVFADMNDKERDSLAGEMATAIARSSEIVMRQGKSLDEALDQFISDDPLDIAATNIAYQIYQVGNEAEPTYVESSLKDYPGYQRSFAETARKQMEKAGLMLVGDYEPLHLRELLGKPTLVRVYAGDNDSVFAASYRVAPKWPGMIPYLFMLLTGKWKKPGVVELETAMSDGQFLITNNSGKLNPFGYGGNIAIEKLPVNASVVEVVKRHRQRIAEYLNVNNKAHALTAHGMEQITALLQKLSESKNRYRKSIGYATEEELRSMLGVQYDKLSPRIRSRLNALASTTA